MHDSYRVEEVCGTLFLKFGNLVVAANIGEENQIADTVRRHFEYLAAAGNERLATGEPPPAAPLDPPREPA